MDLLTLPEIKARAQAAAARKAAIEQKAREDKAALERAAAEALAKAKEAAEALKSAAMNGTKEVKQQIIEEVVCEVKNAKSGEQISGVIHGESSAKSLTLKLGSVLSEEHQGEKLAIKFVVTKAQSRDIVTFEFVDLNRADHSLVRTTNLEELGLQTQCVKQKRAGVVTDGIPAVNNQALEKNLPDPLQMVPLVGGVVVSPAQ